MSKNNHIKKAMILSAGLGTRMGELTKNTPKPLLQINTLGKNKLLEKKSLIEFHLLKLANAGITHCLINTYLYPEKFLEKLGDGKKYGLNITYSYEKEILGTAGGIIQALDFFDEENFILINGDVFTDYNFKNLADLEIQKNYLAHLVLTKNPEHNINGDFYLDKNNQITQNNSGEKLTYTGIAIYSPKLFKDLTPGYRELGELLRQQINKNNLSGEFYNGLWISVDTPERLKKAELTQ